MKQALKEMALGPLHGFRQHPWWSISLVLAILTLTILTQIGGIVLWGIVPVSHRIQRRFRSKIKQATASTGIFILAYMLVLLVLIPPLASLNNRAPLPCFSSDEFPIQPHNIFYPLLARNYVRTDFIGTLEQISRSVRIKYPGSTVRYLDAQFPFLNGFPLLPHLSHNDGRKLDLSFFYRDAETEKPIDTGSPASLGYWAYEQPKPNEFQPCKDKGSRLRWDFDWLQPLYDSVEFDADRTSFLVQKLVQHPKIQKVLIEPHLKKRMGLKSNKIRFQGCRAARHDDHIHVQIEQ